MKNLVHTVASTCFVTWIIGVFIYGLSGQFHFVLAASFVAAAARFLMEKLF